MLEYVVEGDQSVAVGREVLDSVSDVEAGPAAGLESPAAGLEPRRGPSVLAGTCQEPAAPGAEVEQGARSLAGHVRRDAPENEVGFRAGGRAAGGVVAAI